MLGDMYPLKSIFSVFFMNYTIFCPSFADEKLFDMLVLLFLFCSEHRNVKAIEEKY